MQPVKYPRLTYVVILEWTMRLLKVYYDMSSHQDRNYQGGRSEIPVSKMLAMTAELLGLTDDYEAFG